MSPDASPLFGPGGWLGSGVRCVPETNNPEVSRRARRRPSRRQRRDDRERRHNCDRVINISSCRFDRWSKLYRRDGGARTRTCHKFYCRLPESEGCDVEVRVGCLPPRRSNIQRRDL